MNGMCMPCGKSCWCGLSRPTGTDLCANFGHGECSVSRIGCWMCAHSLCMTPLLQQVDGSALGQHMEVRHDGRSMHCATQQQSSSMPLRQLHAQPGSFFLWPLQGAQSLGGCASVYAQLVPGTLRPRVCYGSKLSCISYLCVACWLNLRHVLMLYAGLLPGDVEGGCAGGQSCTRWAGAAGPRRGGSIITTTSSSSRHGPAARELQLTGHRLVCLASLA